MKKLLCMLLALISIMTCLPVAAMEAQGSEPSSFTSMDPLSAETDDDTDYENLGKINISKTGQDIPNPEATSPDPTEPPASEPIPETCHHHWGNWVVIRETTENVNGIEDRTCTVCGETERWYIILPSHTHEYSKKVVAPTCSHKGYTVYTCECGDSYQNDYTDMLPHTWGSWEVTRKAAQDRTGLEERTCSVCGKTESREIPKLPQSHTHKYTKKVIAPNCTQKGYTLYTCSCGDSYQDDFRDALGHNYEVTVIPATCKKEGYTVHECQRCYDYYRDDSVPKLSSHVWGEWVVVVEPTWDEIGQAIRKCTSCGTSQHKWIRKPIAEHPDAQAFETCTVPVVGVSKDKEAKEVLQMLNDLRAENGLPPLEWDAEMEDAAKIRAAECDLKWSHTRPDGSAWHTVSDLVRGENLAKGYFTPESAFAGWKSSSGHLKNMLRPNYTKVYISCVVTDNGWFWCQEFR